MSPGAETARESARQDNGQFGTQPLAEAAVADLTAVSDPRGRTAARAEEAGYPVMASAYEVILDRGEVPADYLADSQMHDEDIEAHHSIYFGPAVDQLAADRYASMAPSTAPANVYTPGANRAARPSSMDELRRECEDADLPAMFGVYEHLANREVLSDFIAKNITYDEVISDYETYIGPAIDQLEERLMVDYREELDD